MTIHDKNLATAFVAVPGQADRHLIFDLINEDDRTGLIVGNRFHQHACSRFVRQENIIRSNEAVNLDSFLARVQLNQVLLLRYADFFVRLNDSQSSIHTTPSIEPPGDHGPRSFLTGQC